MVDNRLIAKIRHHKKRSKLSPQQADAVEILNLQQSPLLRLPGELLNEIYHYVYAGHNLSVGMFPARAHDGECSTGNCLRLTSDDPRSYRLSYLMFTCRKTYAETRLMPFRTCTFVIGNDSHNTFGYLKMLLSGEQMRAIESVKVDRETYFVGLHDELEGLKWVSWWYYLNGRRI